MEQSNVTRLSPRPASQPRPDTMNPVAALIAAIDSAIGDKWSFDLVHHEVVGDETIVLAKLIVDGKYRVAFGGTSEEGSLVVRLNAATLDALGRAAEWMGIQVEGVSSMEPSASRPNQEPTLETGGRITRKQLDYAYSLARDRGTPRDRLAARCLKEFGKKPEYLTKAEASALIEGLRGEEPS